VRHFIVIVQFGLLAWMAHRQSPVIDEVGHLPAAISYWQLGTFDLYRVNPPLSRLVAGAPLMVEGVELDWSVYRSGLCDRTEWSMGKAFVDANPLSWHSYFVAGRLALLPIILLGGYVCHAWARELYGDWSGFFALCLWAFTPEVLALGSTMTPDASSAALGVLAGYCFWKWLKAPSWPGALLAGLTLGLAELSKMTWVVLFPLWPILWLICCQDRGDWRRQAVQLAAILVLAVYILNLGYAFEGFGQPLEDYTFASRTLAGADAVSEGGSGGNRFAGGWLGKLPVPVPKNYLSGMDLQKLDFERGDWSYLNGAWQQGGWWYFYLECAVLKVPLGTWALGFLALGCTIWSVKAYGAGWRHELILLAPALVVFLLVSSQMGFSRYFRYALPCFPFVLIWISKVAKAFELKHWGVALPAGLALLWSVASSLSVYPHSMSYFNELAGGPRNGHRYLIDASIDWGQDLWELKDWCDANPQARPMHAEVRGVIDLKHFGIRAASAAGWPLKDQGRAGQTRTDFDHLGPRPGWYAMSVHRLHDRSGQFDYFLQHYEPVDRIGYSIHIYHITPEDANRVRPKLGLPPLRRAPD